MDNFFIKWLKYKFHVHQWEVINDKVTDVYNKQVSELPIRREQIIIQKCSICGEIKSNMITF